MIEYTRHDILFHKFFNYYLRLQVSTGKMAFVHLVVHNSSYFLENNLHSFRFIKVRI